MSLVGNLEDLSLGDLLQIVSMSQKSGVLVLRSVSGSGQIVFRSGLVHAASVKGRSPDLRGLLGQAGLADGDRIEAALRGRVPTGATSVERLAESTGLPLEQIEAPVRKAAEAAIFAMFGWESGEFSFDAGPEGEGDESFATLRSGINAQYLAMEGMRLRDEQARGGPSVPAAGAPGAADDAPFFGAEPLEVDGDDAIELDAIWEAPSRPSVARGVSAVGAEVEPASGVERAVERVLEREAGTDPTSEQAAAIDAASDGSVAIESVEPLAASPSSSAAVLSARTVVVIDPDAVALEWIKAAIEGQVARTHVFQRAEEGLARIRQYLIRGEVPVVLIALATPIDPLSGIHGLADFVKRLRTQAARIVVIGLNEAGEARPGAKPGHLDGSLSRPTREKLRAGGAVELESARARFVASLGALVARPTASRPSGGEAGTPTRGGPSAERLAELEAALASAQSQHEIHSLLIEAAAGLFTRVAVLALRDGEAFPVAGRGIETLEVDPLASAPRLSCPVPPTSLLGRVVDSGRPATGALRAQADRLLAAMFGPVEPRTAYLAPIVGPAGVVAVLYGDQAGARRAMPDVASLERLVDRAGQELGRIALGRARGEGSGTGR
ncbi:MAG: DUF4388 domain-containing protein [Myxococcota bacterium]